LACTQLLNLDTAADKPPSEESEMTCIDMAMGNQELLINMIKEHQSPATDPTWQGKTRPERSQR
jgi:hypothetical protein